MPRDAADLPLSLQPLCEAIEIVCASPTYGRGWTALGYPASPPHPLREGASPYDGIYRASWTSPGVCVRLDLTHAAVSAELRALLCATFPAQVGADEGFYEYAVDHRSQRVNRDDALAQLAAKVARACFPPSRC
jgi:hypothetical protein